MSGFVFSSLWFWTIWSRCGGGSSSSRNGYATPINLTPYCSPSFLISNSTYISFLSPSVRITSPLPRSMASQGTSIPVPNVQALAATIADAASVPPRYVRPEVADEPITADDEADLPVIDFARLLDGRFAQEESAKLHSACQQWGFFQLINHQVPDRVIERMKADILEFFELPLEEKKEVAQLPNGLEGYGQLFVASEEQKLDWADMLYLLTRPPHARKMNLWPSQPPSFRETLSSYSTEIARVAATLLEIISRVLGITAPEKLLDVFGQELPQGVRINYYPPCPMADKVFGLSPHTDAVVALTVLLQVNDVEGLQIKHEGKWFPVRPLPGAFVVNVCDVLEILSNGKYTSIEHRAMVDPKKERVSIACFLLPREDAVIGPLPELMELQEGRGQVKYRTTNFREYCEAFFSAKLDGKNLVESMKVKD